MGGALRRLTPLAWLALCGCHAVFGYSATVGDGGGPTDQGAERGADAGVDAGSDARAAVACAVPPPGAGILAGRVFEDVDFAGGAGQPSSAGDRGLGGVVVMLWDPAGAPLEQATTDAAGAYRFGDLAPGRYVVRVRADSIPPAGALAEQTYECDGRGGNGAAGALGGQSPIRGDPAAASAEGEHQVEVTLGTQGVGGVDFGFSFELVLNSNDAGQGSLRAFINNANAIGRPLRSRFQIPDGNFLDLPRDPGFDGSGSVVISPTLPLPALTADDAAIDGTSQTTIVGDGDPQGPEVRIDGGGLPGGSVGLTVAGAGQFVRGLALRGFGGLGGAGLLLDHSAMTTVSDNALSGCGHEGDDDGGALRVVEATDVVIADNRLSDNPRDGIHIVSSPRAIVSGNRIDGSGDDGIQVRWLSPEARIAQNVVDTCGGGAVELGASSVAIIDNTLRRCAHGIDCRGGAGVAEGNAIEENGVGVVVSTPGSALLIRGNSIRANAGLGIDLDEQDPDGGVGAVLGVTANDPGDVDDGPNGLLNFPTLERAELDPQAGLLVAGHSSGSARIECFRSDQDPSGHGEGEAPLGVAVEGSAADFDPQKSGDGKNPEHFRVVLPVSAGQLKVGDWITCTASTDTATSEFSKSLQVISPG